MTVDGLLAEGQRVGESALYDTIGRGYAGHRRPDPRIAAQVLEVLGDSGSVLNVGAGAGSYEPSDRWVIAADPSAVMLAQRMPGAAPALRARAEALPFADRAFDAVLAVLTLHHWADIHRGLAECARVARERVVLLTWDATADPLWLVQDYFPEFLEADRGRFPSMAAYATMLGAEVEVATVPVPRDCLDGFLGAYWARPTAYLDARVRGGISSFAGSRVGRGLERLAADLASGVWHSRHGHLLELDALDLGYRLVVARLSASDGA